MSDTVVRFVLGDETVTKRIADYRIDSAGHLKYQTVDGRCETVSKATPWSVEQGDPNAVETEVGP